MKKQKLFSVGDLAHRHGVHETEVIEWAEANDVPRLGREYAFGESEKKKFEKWIARQIEEAVGDGDLDEDDAEEDDGDSEAGDEEDEEDEEDEDSEDEDEDDED